MLRMGVWVLVWVGIWVLSWVQRGCVRWRLEPVAVAVRKLRGWQRRPR